MANLLPICGRMIQVRSTPFPRVKAGSKVIL